MDYFLHLFWFRLLGPGIANELIQIAQQLPGGQGSTRFVITDDSLRTGAETAYFDVSFFEIVV